MANQQSNQKIKSSSIINFSVVKYDGTQPRVLNQWQKFIVNKCKEAKCWAPVYDNDGIFPFVSTAQIQSLQTMETALNLKMENLYRVREDKISVIHSMSTPTKDKEKAIDSLPAAGLFIYIVC